MSTGHEFMVPARLPGVPANLPKPAETRDGKGAFDEKANGLTRQFIKNSEQYAAGAGVAIPAAAPLRQ